MNIDDLKNEGFDLNQGDLFEFLIMQTIANSFVSSEVLRRVTEIQHKLGKGFIDDEAIDEDLQEFEKSIREDAEKAKNDLIAKLYTRNRE